MHTFLETLIPLSLTFKDISRTLSTYCGYIRSQGKKKNLIKYDVFGLYAMFSVAMQLHSLAVFKDGCASWTSLHSVVSHSFMSRQLNYPPRPLFCQGNTTRQNKVTLLNSGNELVM